MKKTIKQILIIAILAITAMSQQVQTGSDASTITNRTLAGYVSDNTNNPIQAVTISAQPLMPCANLPVTTFSDVNGFYQSTVLFDCNYIVTATKTGLTFVENNFLIESGVELEWYFFTAN